MARKKNRQLPQNSDFGWLPIADADRRSEPVDGPGGLIVGLLSLILSRISVSVRVAYLIAPAVLLAIWLIFIGPKDLGQMLIFTVGGGLLAAGLMHVVEACSKRKG